MFALASRRALPRVLRQHGFCLAACLLLAAPGISLAQEEDPPPPPPPPPPPSTPGIIEDKTYASNPGTPFAQVKGLMEKTDPYSVTTQVVGFSAISGEFRPMYSAFVTQGTLKSATEYTLLLSSISNKGGVGLTASYSPPLRDYVRRAKKAESKNTGNYAAFNGRERETDLFETLYKQILSQYGKSRYRDNRADDEAKTYAALAMENADAASEEYERYLSRVRYRVFTSINLFPDALIISSSGIDASQYIDRGRQVQLTASGSAVFLDLDGEDGIWAGRWVLGASWHDISAQYAEGPYGKEFQRWQLQLGAEVVPENAIDRGTIWSVYARLRPKTDAEKNSTYPHDYVPRPEYSLRLGQFPGERFGASSGARDFVQFRAQWPFSY